MAFSRRILGVVVYLAFLGLFLEVALQAFYYATAGDFLFRRVGLPIYAPNEHCGVFNKPHLELEHHTQEFDATYYTNAEGFRVPAPGLEYAREPDAGTYRIMLLGPSFAYGWAVDYEESFAAILERRLEERGYAGGRDVEIINAGVPSMPPAPHLRWYDAVGRQYHPDLVIQFIYGSMNVSNDPQVDASVSEEGYLVPRGHTLARRIRERVKKFATVFYAWIVWTKLDAMLAEPSKEETTILGAGRELSGATEFDVGREEVAEALRFYRDLERTVRADGTELLIVYFPLSYAIHAEDVSRWKYLGVRDVQSQIEFDAAFVRHLNETGVPAIDVTPDLQRAARDGTRLYYWLDIHWTPEGNAATADAVAKYLASGSRAARPAP